MIPFEISEAGQVLGRIFSGQAYLVTHHRLSCKTRGEKVEIALNEVSLHRGNFQKPIQISVHIDGKALGTIDGDGVIVSTATGSTAYNMSAGGSILHHSLSALQIVPIASRSLTARPVVVPGSCTIKLTLEDGDISVVSVDGKPGIDLKLGHSLEIGMAPNPMKLVVEESQPISASWLQSLSWDSM